MMKILENIQWFRCLQKCNPSSNYTEKVTNKKSEKQSDDDKYKFNKSSNSTKTSKATITTKLPNYQIKMKKAFTTLNNRIEDMDNKDYDLTDSEDDGNKSHIYRLRKHNGSKGCIKSQECYQIDASCLFKPLRKGLRRFCSDRTIPKISSNISRQPYC